MTCIIWHHPMKTLGIFCLKEYPNLQRIVNLLSKTSNSWQIFLTIFHLSKKNFNKIEKFVSIVRMRFQLSYVKRPDVLEFLKRMFPSLLCFTVWYWKYLCSIFWSRLQKKGHGYRCYNSSVYMWKCYKIIIASLWNYWRYSLVEL